MTRFQMIIREPGEPPRTVELRLSSIIVGRSPQADVTIDDAEVGREQFKIEIVGSMVYIECVARTNRTRLDDEDLAPRVRVPLPRDATIRAGQTSFQVVAEAPADEPELAPDLEPEVAPDLTMVAPRPAAGGQVPKPRRREDPTDGLGGPMNTMPLPRPVPAPQKEPPRAPAPKAPPAKVSAPPAPRPPAPRPPAPQPPAPQPPVSQPAASAAEQPSSSDRPSTVVLDDDGRDSGTSGAEDLESKLRQAQPRLLFKSAAVKRRVRLTKARTMLGRDESADLPLPCEALSMQHAEIAFDGAAFRLHDQGSTNGTVVDGVRVGSTPHPLLRHSLIVLGTLRAIFLCDDRRGLAASRRLEARAVRQLVRAGHVTRDEGRQAVRLARDDPALSVAEVLLLETALRPSEWASAVAAARARVTWFDRLRRWFSPRSRTPPAP